MTDLLEFLQVQDTVHEFILGMLDPIQNAEVRAIECDPIFFDSKF